MLRHPRRGFGIQYQESLGKGVDTMRGTVSKDMVVDPDTTIRLALSEGALDTLYALALRDHIFDLPETLPMQVGRHTVGTEVDIHFRIESDGKQRDWRWEAHNLNYPLSDDWKRMVRFLGVLDSIVTTQPAYRALPQPRGVYQD